MCAWGRSYAPRTVMVSSFSHAKWRPGRIQRESARPRRPSSAASRSLYGGDVDLLHRHHRLEGALGLSATGRQRVGQRARGDLPGEAPAVLAPTACAFLAAIADNRIPVAVRLRLIVRGDLKGERLAVLERRAAVETEAGNAEDGELHRQNIAGLAARVVARCLVDSGHFTIRKGGGVEPRRVLCVLVEPEADRVFRFHVSFLPKLAALWNVCARSRMG